MSNITSNTVSRRFQHLVEASGQAINLAPAVAEIIAERLRAVLREGETLPDIAFLQTLIGRSLDLLNEQLEAGDQLRKHNKNIARHRREVLEKASTKMRSALVDVRFILDRTLSKREAKAVFEGRGNLTRLKSPVLERVSERLVRLLEDPKFGWDGLADSGHRATAEASRLRLEAALTEFEQAQVDTQPERDALLLAQGSFEREYEQKGTWLRDLVRLLRGVYLGVGFEREAAALILRRRKSASATEEPQPAPQGRPALPAADAAARPVD